LLLLGQLALLNSTSFWYSIVALLDRSS